MTNIKNTWNPFLLKFLSQTSQATRLVLGCFLILGIITTVSLGEDLNPPGFAGASNTGAIFWEFSADNDQPTDYYYIPELTSPEFGFRYYGVMQWQSGMGLNGDGAMLIPEEESLVQKIPSGTGSQLTVQVQITWKGTNPNGEGEAMDIEIWDNDTYMGGGDTFIDETSLSDGWTCSRYEHTFNSADVTHVHLIMHMDIVGDTYLDEVVVDMVLHDGTPPSGPGRPVPHPCRPSNPDPANNEEHVYYGSITLDWTVEGGCDPDTTYDVYFGSSYPPPLVSNDQSNTNWVTPSLSKTQWYYWQVIADVPGEPDPVEGFEWQFKTGGKAYNPSPANGEENVHIASDLSWDGDNFADSYNVYFGTDPTPDSGEYQGNQGGTMFPPPGGDMDPETTYYWRIDEVIDGTPQTGDVWEFTTAMEPPDPAELGFEEILFIQRPSYVSNHFYVDFINFDTDGLFDSDNGIYKYNITTDTVTPIITAADMPGGQGVFYRFDLDWDASRIVFDFKPSTWEGYRIYMCDIDGSNIQQITPDSTAEENANINEYNMPGYNYDMETFNYHFDDMHPCFTQEDTIMFVSTRCKITTLCDYAGTLVTPVIHRINLDGTGMEKLTDSPVSEFAPSMMSDGRVVYTRWEYVDKDSLYCKVGYAMNPDGTHVNEIFGLDQHSPPTLNYFRQVPTNPNKFVCVGAPHCWQGDNLGPILLIDRNKEVRTHEDPGDPTTGPAVTYVTPNVHIWQEPGWNFWTGSSWVYDETGSSGRLYTTPYPINEQQFLVTCKYNQSDSWDTRDAYGLYLIDISGNHIELYDPVGTSCWNPYPLKEREKPIRINALKFPAHLLPNGDPNQGLALVTDVTKGMEGVNRGDVKYLRVNIAVPRPWSAHRIKLWGDMADPEGPFFPSTGWHSALWPRVQLGIVPVEDDGSAYFVVPSDENIFLQALDSEYRELQRERTYVDFRPGEFRACIGCHEKSGEAPTPPFGNSEAPMALQDDPCIPAPMPGESAGSGGKWDGWGVKVLQYPDDIQPIFDSKCISCHYDGGQWPDLSGDVVCEDMWDEGSPCVYNVSFASLEDGLYCGPLINENNDHMENDYTEMKPPKYFGCYNSPLADKIYNDSAHRARLSDEELWKIFRWIDTNYSFYGSYYGRHHGYWEGHPNFRVMPTVEEALSPDAPSWHQ